MNTLTQLTETAAALGYTVANLTQLSGEPGAGVVLRPTDRRGCIAFPDAAAAQIWLNFRQRGMAWAGQERAR